MVEEIDESGFYREDFSTESDWEVFNAQLNEIFQNWDLSNCDWGRSYDKDELFNCEWKIKTEIVKLVGKEIRISYHEAQLKESESSKCVDVDTSSPPLQTPLYDDLMSVKNSFGPPLDGRKTDLHVLARLYGLRRFALIHPHHLEIHYLTNPAEFTFFISAATVVAGEINSAVPIFVQIYDPKWNFFLGTSMAPSLRTNFDVVALDQPPSEFRYLAGLLTMFKEKLPDTYVRPATVSVRNTYSLDTVQLRIPMRIPFSKAPTSEEEEADGAVAISSSQFTALPYGYFPESRTEMYAIYTWPEMEENISIDSALRSDFVPSKAPSGSIHQNVHASSYLSSCLRDYCKLYAASEALDVFVGRDFSGVASGAKMGNPLDKLATPHLHQLRSYRQRSNVEAPLKKIPGPMNDNELNQMLCYLFPDLQPETALFPYTNFGSGNEIDPHRIKSALPDSLVGRLSCLLATCYAHFGGKSGLAQLWAAFTRELRFLWDYNVMVPRVAAGFPDTRSCLLHQKLQMLNVCIERRAEREFGFKADVPKETLNPSDDDEDGDGGEGEEEEEEFYDCPNEEEEDDQTLNESSGSGGGGDDGLAPAKNKAIKTMRPEGRQKPLGDNLTLLNSDELLYVPITQEPVPKTEDQLQDDAEAMLKMGPGSGLTTEMMCSSLLSDMEAFKAANPQAEMEDFIRWYSPRDWEIVEQEDGSMKGRLSGRMQTADNTWQSVWKQAKPVPAWRQKRLFDDTNEALKVLQYLETRNIREIYELTLVPLLHAAITKLKDIFHSAKLLDLFTVQIDEVLADLSRLSRDVEIIGDSSSGSFITQAPDPDRVLRKIEALERHFYQYKCFERSSGYPHCSEFEELKRQFQEILKKGGSCDIITKGRVGGDSVSAGGGEGMNVGGMMNPSFKNDMAEQLISKDYVIRVDGETTSTSKGRAGPQFLRAIVTGDKIRLCGAFTENTTFV